jgi:hypothetical protein
MVRYSKKIKTKVKIRPRIKTKQKTKKAFDPGKHVKRGCGGANAFVLWGQTASPLKLSAVGLR